MPLFLNITKNWGTHFPQTNYAFVNLNYVSDFLFFTHYQTGLCLNLYFW